MTTPAYNLEIEGWMSPVELEWLHETAKKMYSVVELGSWKGRSTFALLSGCPGKVHAIDTWRGSVDHDSKTGVCGVCGQAVADSEGVLADFTRNVGHFKNLCAHQSDSADAAHLFLANRSVDMVFIDAGHYYNEVLADIQAWLPKTRLLICGHDYQYPDVGRAVHETFGSYANLVDTTSIWYVYLPTCQTLYEEAAAAESDIQGHVRVLQSLAACCGTVTEFGVRTGISTRALASGMPRSMVSYDINPFTDAWRVQTAAEIAGKSWRFEQANSLEVTIEPTDLLFIDTFHSYGQLLAELLRHGNKAKQYIVLHDTETFARHGMDGVNRGLMDAVEHWISGDGAQWQIVNHWTFSNGLTILGRK